MHEQRLMNEAFAASMLLNNLKAEQHEESGDSLAEEEHLNLILASETNLHETMEQVLAAIALDEAHCTALTLLLNDLNVRLARKRARIERRRGALLAAMETIGQNRLELPNATLTVSAGKAKVIVTDQSTIPGEYMRRKIVEEPNKQAIALAWRDGSEIPGTMMSNVLPILTVRTR
jgi:Siphovirus Gp157